jgi:Ca2+-binding EF-hand superfamily protein
MESLRMLNPGYAKASEYSQFFLTSGKGGNLRRLLINLGVSRRDVTYFFKLFMAIDEDDSGMITLDEFFKYLSIDWNPFVGKAFHQFDADTEGMSADQLEPDEWLVGLLNYCTLTPEALARFAFELYDDDGSEFISHEELSTMVDDVFGDE